jgi:hypothetical protein
MKQLGNTYKLNNYTIFGNLPQIHNPEVLPFEPQDVD